MAIGPQYFEDYDLNGDGALNTLDITIWANIRQKADIQ